MHKQTQFAGRSVVDATARKCVDSVESVESIPARPEMHKQTQFVRRSVVDATARKCVDSVESVESVPARPEMHKQTQFARPAPSWTTPPGNAWTVSKLSNPSQPGLNCTNKPNLPARRPLGRHRPEIRGTVSKVSNPSQPRSEWANKANSPAVPSWTPPLRNVWAVSKVSNPYPARVRNAQTKPIRPPGAVLDDIARKCVDNVESVESIPAPV